MRAAIVRSGGYLDNVVNRILANNRINGDFVTQVNQKVIVQYDVIIFTYQNHIPNITKVIEQIALTKQIQIIYISNTVNIGQFYNVLYDIHFTYIEEQKMEFVLPAVIEMSIKYNKTIQRMEEDLHQAKSEYELLKKTNQAKRILIHKGYTEEQAHKYIVNKAMELRVPKIKLVNLIIENKIDI